ncbi:MAG: PorT family protein [Sphingobacteriales bacterium]|nr:MAG: PorT family protein [Sphingobacteriales bacterium]
MMMRILLYSIFCLCLLPSLSRAQQDISIGLKGGLSIPNLSAGETKNDWNKDYISRIGPNFGAFVEIGLSRKFSLVPELMFSGQGGRRKTVQPMTIPEQYLSIFQTVFNTSNDYVFANLENVSRINYLQLPVHIKFSQPIALKQKLSVYIQAGPYIGYMLSARQIVKSENLRVYASADPQSEIDPQYVHTFFGSAVDTIIEAKKDLYSWNYGVSGAAGLSCQLKKGKIVLEAGGNYGFRYIQKGADHGKNRIGAGVVMLGYSYPLCIRKKA